MSDSSVDDDLFGNHENEHADKINELKNDFILKNKSSRFSMAGAGEMKIASSRAPGYTETNEFQQFTRDQQVSMHSKYGYICIYLCREFYFQGQTVRGFALVDLFSDVPSKEIMIRVKGREIPGKHGQNITKKLMNEPIVFQMESISNRLQSKSTLYQAKNFELSEQQMHEVQMIQFASNEQGKSGSGIISMPPLPQVSRAMNKKQSQPMSKTKILEVNEELLDSYPKLGNAVHNHATNSSQPFENSSRQAGANQPPQDNMKSLQLFKPQSTPIGENFKNNAQILQSAKSVGQQTEGQQRKTVSFLNPDALKLQKTLMNSNDGKMSQDSINIDELVGSALVLSRKKVSRKEDVDLAKKSIPLLESKLTAFTFKDQVAKKGFYRLPFSFNLPSNIPGSFIFSKDAKSDESLITIEYVVEVSIEVRGKDDQELLKINHKKVIDVREQLFTDDEIEEDWKKYQQIMDLKKVLRPNNIMGSRGNPNVHNLQADQMINGAEIKFGQDENLQNKLSLKKIVRDTNKQLRRESLEEQGSLKLKLNQMMIDQQHGISNSQWTMDHVIQQSRCLCFKSSYTMKIQAQLNKRLFFPDEAVKVELEVDNSHSSRDIKEIRCSLKHEITIRKGKTALQKISNTLCMLEKIEINKRERKQRQEFEFDLKEIFSELKSLWQEQHKGPIKRRSSLVNQSNPGTSIWEAQVQINNKTKSLQKEQASQSYKKFNKNRMSLLKEVEDCTLYTVHGISIVSDFTIELAIVVNDVLGETIHEKSFPFTIRSRKNGDFINDLDSLGAFPVMSSVNKILEEIRGFHPEMPISLPGCNFQTKLEQEQFNQDEH